MKKIIVKQRTELGCCRWEQRSAVVATTKGDDGSDDDVAMSTHVSREKRWGDIDL